MADIIGTLRNDRLNGTISDDRIFGDTTGNLTGNSRGGNDQLFGNAGDDDLFGDAGDRMLGSSRGGNDRLNGGIGNDTIFGDAQVIADNARGGNDQVVGGDGDDTLFGDAEVMFENARGGNDQLDGGNGNDRLSAQAGNDRLNGGNGLDLLEGGQGNDLLDGGAGDDSFNGGPGRNTVSDPGFDIYDGGEGTDTAFYVGGVDDYIIEPLPGGVTRVTHTATGEFDRLFRIENIEFELPSSRDLDVVVANAAGQPNVWLANDGGAVFGSPIALPTIGEERVSVGVSLADANGDGALDVFVANDASANLLLLNNGAGDFSASTLPGSDLAIHREIALGDVDGDGDVDALVARVEAPQQLLRNMGGAQGGAEGEYEIAQTLPSLAQGGGSDGNAFAASLADLDADGGILMLFSEPDCLAPRDRRPRASRSMKAGPNPLFSIRRVSLEAQPAILT